MCAVGVVGCVYAVEVVGVCAVVVVCVHVQWECVK